MNLFLILIPQSLNSQFLNLAPYSHYDEDGVQKSDLALRSNNKVYYITKQLRIGGVNHRIFRYILIRYLLKFL